MILWLYLVLAFVVGIYFLTKRSKPRNLPPGPTQLPIIGNAHQVDFINMHLTFDEWSKKFGEIVYARFFEKEVIILNSFDAVREAFVRQGDNFSARPEFYIFEQQSSGRGYSTSQGQMWKEQRRHGLHVLRDMGLGRSVQEEKIVEEALDLFTELEKDFSSSGGRKTGTVNPSEPLKFAVVNVITNILFSKRFQHGDPQFVRLHKLVVEIFTLALQQMPMEFITVLRYFPWLFKQQQSIDATNEILDYFKKEIDEHKEGLDDDLASGNPSDFVYAYLQEVRTQNQAGENSATSFTEAQLQQNLLDLFTGGFETTATTLSWFILYMLHFPDVQEKMREEILEKVGGSYPTWADKSKLPFCCAVVAEVQRHANIVPFGMFHSCFEDATVKGFHVPELSIVVPNHWTVMRDDKVFSDATSFNPERFIQPNGTFNDKVDGFMPFSIGRRACMGESLARMELFLFATAMVRRYAMRPPAEGLPSMKYVPQFTLAPQPFDVVLEVNEGA